MSFLRGLFNNRIKTFPFSNLPRQYEPRKYKFFDQTVKNTKNENIRKLKSLNQLIKKRLNHLYMRRKHKVYIPPVIIHTSFVVN